MICHQEEAAQDTLAVTLRVGAMAGLAMLTWVCLSKVWVLGSIGAQVLHCHARAVRITLRPHGVPGRPLLPPVPPY